MKLDIQYFNDGVQRINTEQLNGLAGQITDVVAALKQSWEELRQDTNSLESESGLVTDSGVSFAQSVTAVEGEFSELIDVVALLGKNLVSAVSTYEDINVKITGAIDDWSATFKNALQGVIGGLTSTAPKGSYPVGTYLSDMSKSTQVIVNEMSGMAQKTGDAFASLTGNSVVGTIKTVFDWIGNKVSSSTGSSFIRGIFG